jgi:hypothetical protein
MGFRLIKGTFHVTGYSPDGDSVRFRADDESKWHLLGSGPLQMNSQKHVQLRLEAIDTLETHFVVSGGEVHQPRVLANAATDFLLHFLEITAVVWDASHHNIIQAKDGTRGYILSRQKDRNGGRPVSIVFAGDPPEADGSDVFLDGQRLQQSLNYQSLAAGHAYPTYYQGFPLDLLKTLTEAVAKARVQRLGLYKQDKTNMGMVLDRLAVVTDEQPILPKLFRRLTEFIGFENLPDLTGFFNWLASRDQKSILVISTQQVTRFHDLIEIDQQRVRLLELPENLIFPPS